MLDFGPRTLPLRHFSRKVSTSTSFLGVVYVAQPPAILKMPTHTPEFHSSGPEWPRRGPPPSSWRSSSPSWSSSPLWWSWNGPRRLPSWNFSKNTHTAQQDGPRLNSVKPCKSGSELSFGIFRKWYGTWCRVQSRLLNLRWVDACSILTKIY